MDASEKQGYIGELSKKTTVELSELLKRQQKILENVKFIGQLPDKGERLTLLVTRITTELHSRMDVDAAADLFHEMILDAERGNKINNTCAGENDELTDDPLKQILNTSVSEKIVTDQRKNNKMLTNNYEKIIKKSSNATASTKKFYPHKSQRSQQINKNTQLEGAEHRDIVTMEKQPSKDLESSSVSSVDKENDQVLPNSKKMVYQDDIIPVEDCPKNTLGLQSENPNLKHRYDDNLEKSVYEPSRKYDGAKVISIEESFQLQEKHRKEHEMLKSRQAADRLAKRFGVKMVDYEPKFETRYREQDTTEVDSDHDSSDSNAEVDYPD